MKATEFIIEGVAGPKNCWPGYRKTGTQPGTGKNKGKRVNDCEKIKEDVELAEEFDLIERIIEQIADQNAVDVELDDRGRRPVLNVKVGAGDMGRVIGKRGRVAQSIRTVVRAAAARDGGDVEVEFLD